MSASSFFALNGSASLLAFQQISLLTAPSSVPSLPTHVSFAAPIGTYIEINLARRSLP